MMMLIPRGRTVISGLTGNPEMQFLGSRLRGNDGLLGAH